jgi:hypothetical protein
MKEEGMVAVDLDVQKKVLRLEYDLNKVKFEVIEKSLKKLGVKLSKKFSERWKRGMVKYTEQNELDNLNAPLTSCCDDPKGEDRHCKKAAKKGKNFSHK